MDFTIFIIITALLIVQGFVFMYCADLPIIFREIAINTRNGKPGPEYKTVDKLSGLINFFGLLCWILCVIHIVYALTTSGYLKF